MKARLVINELRRATAPDTLSSLGVGKIVELRAYKWFQENLPFQIRDAKPMDVAFADESYDDLKRIIKKRLAINIADYKWFDNHADAYNWTITSKIIDFFREMDDLDEFFSLNQHRFSSSYHTGTVCKYSKTYSAGLIDIRRHDTLGTVNGWFVKFR